ncbi:MAG: hypothetical protein ABIE22_05195 [archaeon]
MRKRGQFYIVAAVVIVIALVSLVSVTNYLRAKNKETKIYDLGKEVGGETGQVYDYGTYNIDNLETAGMNIDDLANEWLTTYVEYASNYGPSDWLFVYGDYSQMNVLTFTNVTTGRIRLDFGGSPSFADITATKGAGYSFVPGIADKINVTFFDYSYEFDLKEGENFYFVIRKEGYVEQG